MKCAKQASNTMDRLDVHLEYARFHVDLAKFCIDQANESSGKAGKNDKQLIAVNAQIEAARYNLSETKRLIDKISQEHDLEPRRRSAYKLDTEQDSNLFSCSNCHEDLVNFSARRCNRIIDQHEESLKLNAKIDVFVHFPAEPQC